MAELLGTWDGPVIFLESVARMSFIWVIMPTMSVELEAAGDAVGLEEAVATGPYEGVCAPNVTVSCCLCEK